MTPKRFQTREEHAETLLKYNINPQKAMFTIILSILVDVFGYSMVLPLLPVIARTFGASDIFIGVIISSNALSALIFGPLWGKLSDKYGRKPILLISQAGTGVSFLILALSDSIYIILFARILDGIFGGQIPVIRAYIADITTPITRSAQMGKMMIGHTFGMILGPIIGGVLGEFNWRFPPLFAAGLTILAIFLTFFVLIESMPKERINDLFTMRQKAIAENTHTRIWSKELLLRLIEVYILFVVTGMFMTSFSLILADRYGADTFAIGMVMTVAGLALMVYGGFLIKPLIKKISEKRLFLLGILTLIIIAAIFPFLYELWMVYVYIIPFAFCMATIGPLLQSNVTKTVDQDKQGTVSGWSTNVQSFSQITAPLISTGYLQIGGITIVMLLFDSYFLIGLTAALLAIVLIITVFIDLKKHPYLYEHEEKQL
jgi:DHA1 family tetracycline resistance protein-like MFS transporter